MGKKPTKYATMPCVVCGVAVTGTLTEMSPARMRDRAYCSKEHVQQWRATHPSRPQKIRTMPCARCGKPVTGNGKEMSDAVTRGRAYCSPEHAREWTVEHNRKTGHETATRHAAMHSARMKASNPMRDPVTRAKVSTTHRARGWKPPVRGGNGTGPTVPQTLLACALGWPCEVTVKTGFVPHHYKIDIANETLKIAIEVDGSSHNGLTRQASDRRKDAKLTELGWTVLRFSNEEVTERLEACVQTVLSTISKSKAPTPTA